MTGPSEEQFRIGLLAVQQGLLAHSVLFDAVRDWCKDEQRALVDVLLAQAKEASKEALAAFFVSSAVELSPSRLVSDEDIARVQQLLIEAEKDRTDTHEDEATTTQQFDSEFWSKARSNPGEANRFRIISQHAKGGLGVIFKAEDLQLHRTVALKQIQGVGAQLSVVHEKFYLEAEVTGQLEHPGIVPVYALGIDDRKMPFYAMRFIRGDDLRTHINDLHAAKTSHLAGLDGLALRKLLRRFLDVCNAVEYAHARGVLHRDLKPANIMLGSHGETLVVDWGLAKVMQCAVADAELRLEEEEAKNPGVVKLSGSGGQTVDGSFGGTPAYAPPEQLAGKIDLLCPQSDVYSLGAILYQLLTGVPPISGKANAIADLMVLIQKDLIPRPTAIRSGVPRPLEAICRKAMSSEISARYVSAKELATDVEFWLADECVLAYRGQEPLVERAGRLLRRYRSWTVSTVFGIGVAIACWHSTNALAQDTLVEDSNCRRSQILSGAYFHLTDTEQNLLDSEGIADFVNQKQGASAGLPEVVTASMLQQTPMLEPRITIAEQNRNPIADVTRFSMASNSLATSRSTGVRSSFFGTRDRVAGAEALPQASSDLGDLLRKSPSALSVGVQSKTPVIHDPRVRGSRVGSLAASGSHWVPARADLDTMLSKFDSRQVESTTITPGPYTSLLGPGFAFTDVQLLSSPRYRNGPEAHGDTDLEYRANGNQFFGQQSVLLGSSNWGSRFNYSNRSGDDYVDGNNNRVPSSYRSQEMTLALGRDWANDSVEVNVLRLDQTDLVFPGYVFDIDFLVTDGYEVTHTRKRDGLFDRVQTDVWYNRTRFEGNAQNPRKRPFFPVLDLIAYEGFTDVDSMSTGYRQAFVVGGSELDSFKFSIGHDLRFIKQELNEISNSLTLGLPTFFLPNRNSPIPKSYIVNPGLFAEYEEEVGDRTMVKMGGRVDYAASDITDDPGKLAAVGLDFNPTTYAEVVGTNRFDRDFNLLSGFMSLKQTLSEEETGTMSLGYAERAPTLTELYAAQPFMLLLQNGLNNVTGDPTLKKEKLLQFDLGYEYRAQAMNAGIRGYHAWAFDYLTFENTQTTNFPPDADARQVSLRYVNTDLATLTGAEAFSELFPKAPISPFANLRFVDGIDRTRNGSFATTNGSQGNASQKDPTQVRGAASGVAGASSEALPNIPPLDTRLGLRFHDTSPNKRWSIEMSTRIVNRQKRVAASLLESATAGFSTWDLRSVFRPAIHDRLVISTGVENIFDRHYREHFDYRTQSGLSVFQPGANFYLSTSLTY